MAIYYCKTQHVSRSSGRSAVAAAAYRSASQITDQRMGLTHNFTKKQGVIHTQIFTPQKMDISRHELWNKAEAIEKRKDSRTAREWILALPSELNQKQCIELTEQFAQDLVNRYGVAVDVAIHAPDHEGDLRNYHAHVLTTTRKVSFIDHEWILGDKTSLELSDTKLKKLGLEKGSTQIDQVRSLWADRVNQALVKYQFDQRVDHRSYERQGIDKQAQQHEGPKVTQLRRMGIETQISISNDLVKAKNAGHDDLLGLKQEIITTQKQLAELRSEAADCEFDRIVNEVKNSKNEGNTDIFDTLNTQTSNLDQKDLFLQIQSSIEKIAQAEQQAREQLELQQRRAQDEAERERIAEIKRKEQQQRNSIGQDLY